MYSVTNKDTFSQIDKFRTQIVRNHESKPIIPPIILVGNKMDADAREVTLESGKEKAAQYNCNFIESSAKNCTNIKEIFHTIVKSIRIYREQMPQPSKSKKSKSVCTLL